MITIDNPKVIHPRLRNHTDVLRDGLLTVYSEGVPPKITPARMLWALGTS